VKLNKIYNMDCLEGLKRLEDESVDLIVTDPPYNINLKPPRKLTKSIINDNLKTHQFSKFLNSIFKELYRCLKNDVFLLSFVGWSTIPEFRKVLDKYFELKSMPIWVKNNFGIGHYTRPQYEPLLLYFKGNPNPLKKPISDVWFFDKVLKPIHSCQKPEKLIEFIINNFSKRRNLILDPFMGSGTTAVACLKTQRNFIGFEISKEYCDIAEARLKPWREQTRIGIFEESKEDETK